MTFIKMLCDDCYDIFTLGMRSQYDSYHFSLTKMYNQNLSTYDKALLFI